MYGPARPPAPIYVQARTDRGSGRGGRGRGRGKASTHGDPLKLRATTKKRTTGWEIEQRDLPPNNLERRLYHEAFPVDQRIYYAVNAFRSLRQWARLFLSFLGHSGIYMHLLATKYDGKDSWLDIEDELEIAAAKKNGTTARPPRRRGLRGEERTLNEIERCYDRVLDVEGVVRSFLTGYLENEGLDRNLDYVEAAATVVYSFVRFLVQRNVLPELEDSVGKAYEVVKTALKSMPAAFKLPSHLPGVAEKSLILLLNNSDTLDLDAIVPPSKMASLGPYTDDTLTTESALLIARQHLGTTTCWKVARRSTGHARRIDRIEPRSSDTGTKHILHLSSHTNRPDQELRGQGWDGPLSIMIDEAALPFTMQNLVIEGDFLEIVPIEEGGNGRWVVEHVWIIRQPFHLATGDEYGELPEEEDGQMKRRGSRGGGHEGDGFKQEMLADEPLSEDEDADVDV